jgi:hypothetical protein
MWKQFFPHVDLAGTLSDELGMEPKGGPHVLSDAGHLDIPSPCLRSGGDGQREHAGAVAALHSLLEVGIEIEVAVEVHEFGGHGFL